MKENDHSALVLGFSQIGSESGWRMGETRSIRDAAEGAGISLMFFNALQKQENQIKHIRSLIAYQVDVIAFSPIVTIGWDSVLQEASAAGIPVILVDRGITTSLDQPYACEVGYDVLEEGRKAARFLLKKFHEPRKPIRIFELRGTDLSTSSQLRHDGFIEILGKYQDQYSIVVSESGDFMTSRGYEITRRILSEGPQGIDVLFSHNDAMTLGALQAMDDLGINPGEDITIISFDGEQKAVDELKAGRINCIVECNPLLGELLIEAVRKLTEGQTVPEKITVSGGVFTEFDEGLQALLDRGY